jgi:hypothetical protein
MYWKPAIFVGLIAFAATWLYAIAGYGFWLGICLGWFPAAIIGLVAAATWPIVAVGAIVVGGLMLIDVLRTLPYS